MPAASPWPKLGRPLGARLRSKTATRQTRPRGVKFRVARQPNYQRIKAEVAVAIEQLPASERNFIPADSTLPELIVALALLRLRLLFQAQNPELGGRLELGGGVVDFKVFVGAGIVIVRVQGDYWHSLPERVLKDALQYDRLHRLGYRVADLWEGDLYQAWVDGRVTRLVEDAINAAA